jgi:hypothetical protein
MNDPELLNQINIAKPCPALWEEMRGDDRKRVCDHCHKNVYNFAAMTALEGAALIRATEGRICGRIFRRRDGTVLTVDCPVGVERFWKRSKQAICAAAAVVIFGVGAGLAAAQGREAGTSLPRLRQQFTAQLDQTIYKIKGWLGIYQPRAMAGDIALPMGKIAMPSVCPIPPKKNQEQ